MSFEYPGKLEIGSITITAASGKTLDITPQVVEVDIYETLFANTLSGTLTIADSAGIISALPIVGNEACVISLKTPITDKKLVEMYVYKVSNRVKTNSRSDIYILHLISPEAIIDAQTSFSRSYSGKHSDIVKKIFRDVFTGSKRLLELEDSSSSTKFINPYWNPFQCINWVANRSFTKSHIPSYFFFETLDGFKFYSTETLSTKSPVFEYVLRPTKIPFDKGDIKEKMKTIIDMSVKESGSTLELMMNGAFGSRLITKDVNSNSVSSKTLEYSNTFGDNYKRLNEFKLKSNLDAFGNTNENPSFTKLAAYSSYTSNGSNDSSEFSRWVLERKSIIEQLTSNKLEALVHGNVGVTVGSTVDVAIPMAGVNNALDKFVSGKYLVMGIRHIISGKEKHLMTLELAKDSYASSEHLRKIMQ